MHELLNHLFSSRNTDLLLKLTELTKLLVAPWCWITQCPNPFSYIIYRFSQWRIDEYEDVKFNNPDELGEWVNALKDAGADILHVSTRNATNPGFPDHDTTRTLAGWTRKLAGLPVIAVGKISVTLTMDQAFANDERKQKETVTDPAPAFSLLEKGEADLLAIGRSLITNPDWVQIVRDQTWKNLKPFNPTQLATLE